jgi:hypothetical protein
MTKTGTVQVERQRIAFWRIRLHRDCALTSVDSRRGERYIEISNAPIPGRDRHRERGRTSRR